MAIIANIAGDIIDILDESTELFIEASDVGRLVGDDVGRILGDDVGRILGDDVGRILGDDVGKILGDDVGRILGDDVGKSTVAGTNVGLPDGIKVGK
jgi:hypothetical protein